MVVVAVESALALGDTAKAMELIAFMEEAPAERRAPFYEAQAQRFRAEFRRKQLSVKRPARSIFTKRNANWSCKRWPRPMEM